MKKDLRFSMLLILIVIASGGCKKSSGTQDDPIDATQHDNYLFLDPYFFNPTITYSEITHSISSGQPWGGVTTSYNSGIFEFDVKAGRHKTSGVADWFKSNCSKATGTMDPGMAWPDDLNFAYTGTITIDGNSYDITIGQGSSMSGNNWWIGGPGWTIHSGVYANVVTPDGKYFFMPEEDDENHFWLKTSY
jgi:hypothetical protein